MKKIQKVLALVFDGFEEIELITPVDLLRRAEADVLIAATGSSLLVTGRSRIHLTADCHLSSVNTASFDALLIPGGPGIAAQRELGHIAPIAADFVANGKTVAAICAAPLILADAGVLAGRKFTAHFSTGLHEADSSRPVVTDGPIITSRGAGTAMDFALALLSHLCGDDTKSKVSSAIML